MSLSKEQTGALKGIAILVMIYHHFFGAYRVEFFSIQSTDYVFSLCRPLAVYGKACVSMFAFVTGYGYYIKAEKEKHNVARAGFKCLSSFFPFFVFMCILFYLLGCLFPYGMYLNADRWNDIALNLIGLKQAIPDYWYICIVILSALLYYPLLLAGKRRGQTTYLLIFGLLILFPICVFKLSFFVALFDNDIANSQIIRVIQNTVPWVIFFMLGWSYKSLQNDYLRKKWRWGCFLLTTSSCLIYHPSATVLTIVAIIIVTILNPKSIISIILQTFGIYSAAMWLNHRLIFGYWFSDFFYGMPTPLNYILITFLSMLLAIVTIKIARKLRFLKCQNVEKATS